jgi:fermentation-respiration switch protein FrsA (DUF1100 family)
MKTRLETIEFAAGDQRLAGTFLAPAAVLPGILFVHGWGGSQEQDLDRARQAAASAVPASPSTCAATSARWCSVRA